MPTTTNAELVSILKARKVKGGLTKMNRKQLEALVKSTGGGFPHREFVNGISISGEDLVEQYNVVVATSNKYGDEAQKLKAENEKLKAFGKFWEAEAEQLEKMNTNCFKEVKKLTAENEKRLKDAAIDGIELIKMRLENKELTKRVDIMEKCKKLWYDKCQEDPDDDPERTGIKWSICLEGALNHFTNQNRHYEESYDEMKADKDELNKEKEELFDKNEELKAENENWEADDANLTKIICMINELDEDIGVSGVDDIFECVEELNEKVKEFEEKIEEIRDYIELGENANEIKVFNDIMNK